MSGYTKHMYDKDMHEINKTYSQYIKNIIPLLPKEYEFEDILNLIKAYYPFEWQILNEKYESYSLTDRRLKKQHKKVRYNMHKPEKIIFDLKICKELLEEEYQKTRREKYDSVEAENYKSLFDKKQLSKVTKRREKINRAKQRSQAVEPEFLDVLIGFYDRKNASQKDRVYIMKELERYDCPKVTKFFQRKAHSEYNKQLRQMAFYHLQEFGHYTVLRKQKYMQMHTKNKKRRKYLKDEYADARYNIKEIPEELEYRIENSKDQKIKSYDYFISHSSVDFKFVQLLIQELNKEKKYVYCDWINDTDYLKRKLVGPATLNVIKKRIEQSQAVIWVDSSTSRKSKWVKYELNYANELQKKIYSINVEDEKICNEQCNELKDLWFLDKNYTELELFE